MKTKTKISKRKLVAYGLGIGGCSAMLAGSAEAVLVDVTFDFGTVLDKNLEGSPISSTGVSNSSNNKVSIADGGGDVGRISWKGFYHTGKNKVNVALGGYGAGKGFYFDSAFASTGEPTFVSNSISSTWGDGSHLSGNGTKGETALGLSSAGNTAFWSGNYSNLTIEADTTGVIGFKTHTNKWGYVEFDWDATAQALTILSAKAETVANTPVTFTVAAVPEANPATLMALFSLGAVGLRTARRRKAA